MYVFFYLKMNLFHFKKKVIVLHLLLVIQISCSGVVVVTIAQLHSTKPELRFFPGTNPARGVLQIRDSEDL